MRGGRGRIGFGSRPSQAVALDALQTVLAGLAADTWSGNIATNQQSSCNEVALGAAGFGSYYAAPGEPDVSCTTNIPFGYSSGDYAPSAKKYFFTGGGHNNWVGSEVSAFDMATLTWARKDESAKVAQFPAGDVPFESAVTTEIWYAHRNPSGRFAPIASHMYAGMAYMPHNEKFYVEGGAPYKSGVGSVGGSTWIDVSTGHWDETGAFAASLGGGKVNCVSLYIATCKMVGDYSTFTPTGVTFHGVLRFTEYRDLWLVNVDSLTNAASFPVFSAFGKNGCVGTLITDPADNRFLAYIGDSDTSGKYYICHRVNAYRGTSGTSSSPVYGDYGNSTPAGVGAGRWIYMGDYIPGCTKIAVFDAPAGLYGLDIANIGSTGPTWSSQLASAPIADFGSGESCWKRFFYMPTYDAFGCFDHNGANFYVLKRPSYFS
jgi:hypothetical protein